LRSLYSEYFASNGYEDGERMEQAAAYLR